MADDMNDSYHSFSHPGASSFRILNPASELPSRNSRPLSAPGLGDSAADWTNDNSLYVSSTTSRSSVIEPRLVEDDDNLNGIPTTKGVPQSQSSQTLRPPSVKPVPIAVPPLGPNTKYVSAPKKTPRVLKREVWRDLLLTSNGRDKAFKLIQYSIRVYLWFHASTLRKFGTDFNKRLRSVMSGFSLVRKCLIMFNWLTPLLEITNPPPLPYSDGDSLASKRQQKRSLLHRFLHASPPTLIDFANFLADDTYTLHRLGLFPDWVGYRADRTANWLWFLGTLAGLVEVETDIAAVEALMKDLDNRIYDVELDSKTTGRSGKKGSDLVPNGQPNNVDLSVGVEEAEAGLHKLKKQSQGLKITRWKLLMDLVFVSYEVFRVNRFREAALTFSGLASAVLSSWKLYDKQRLLIAKAHADD